MRPGELRTGEKPSAANALDLLSSIHRGIMKTDTKSMSGPRSADRLRLMVASAFWLGLSPVAPGTCGALLGVLIHFAAFALLPPDLCTGVLVGTLLLVCAANHFLTPWAVAHWKSKDPSHFVLDEVAGYLVVPILFHHGRFWQVALWGFILFRVLDIVKIPPARQIDRELTGSWGIVLDDLVSGCYAVLGLYAMMWIGRCIGFEAWLVSSSG